MSHCRQLQTGDMLHQSLHELEGISSKAGAKEHNLQVDITWIFLISGTLIFACVRLLDHIHIRMSDDSWSL